METTGDGIRTATELSTGMEFGHDQFHTSQASALFDIDRNTATVVFDFD